MNTVLPVVGYRKFHEEGGCCRVKGTKNGAVRLYMYEQSQQGKVKGIVHNSSPDLVPQVQSTAMRVQDWMRSS